MKAKYRFLLVLGLTALIAAGCNKSSTTSTDQQNSSASSAPTTTSQSQSASSDILKTALTSALGTFLTASNGDTLYMFTKDTPNTSTCYNGCAATWPPYTVNATNKMGVGSDIKGKVGTTKRTNGVLQVTYNGEPLYLFHNDTKPGDTNGQGVGGVWFVVKP